mmetsp:Transcript_32434/g.48310  ORF Transcript_32434/g.48310 Transcript_32434/m.48310 type:complete len:80 (+) Transcript_32434:3-242(+)
MVAAAVAAAAVVRPASRLRHAEPSRHGPAARDDGALRALPAGRLAVRPMRWRAGWGGSAAVAAFERDRISETGTFGMRI